MDCVMCVKKDMTLYIMVSLLIDVIIKPHVSVTFLLQYEWILERCCKAVELFQVLQLLCSNTSCLLRGVKVAYLVRERHYL